MLFQRKAAESYMHTHTHTGTHASIHTHTEYTALFAEIVAGWFAVNYLFIAQSGSDGSGGATSTAPPTAAAPQPMA